VILRRFSGAEKAAVSVFIFVEQVHEKTTFHGASPIPDAYSHEDPVLWHVQGRPRGDDWSLCVGHVTDYRFSN
jgi:hypothetical protein